MKLRAILGFSLLLLASPATPQEQPEPFPPAVSQGLRAGVMLDQYLKQVLEPFRTLARQGILKREDLENLAVAQEAAKRQRALALFVQLDFDGDGTVTPEEIEAARNKPDSRLAARFGERMLSAKGGGSLTILDAYQDTASQAEALGMAGNASKAVEQMYEGYLALGDGRQVTAAQLTERALSTFRAVDSNGDATISAEEFAAAEPRISKVRYGRQDLTKQVECAFPAPSATAETVLLGAYEGDAIASVYVSDRGEETTTSNIVIRPGKTPNLYRRGQLRA